MGKINQSSSFLPTGFVINKNNMASEITIAIEFNKFFTSIGPGLARKTPSALIKFQCFLSKIGTTMPAISITFNELKEAFFR